MNKKKGKTPPKKIYEDHNDDVGRFEEAELKRSQGIVEKKDDGEKKRDKIFDNDFNTGNISTENLPNIRVDFSYASGNLSEYYTADEYYEKTELTQLVYKSFKESQWGNLPLNKKFSKELMPFIFKDILKDIDGKGYSATDMFICIAEFMDVTYEKAYEAAPLRIKERIIKELDNKYHLLKKKNIKRLF